VTLTCNLRNQPVLRVTLIFAFVAEKLFRRPRPAGIKRALVSSPFCDDWQGNEAENYRCNRQQQEQFPQFDSSVHIH